MLEVAQEFTRVEVVLQFTRVEVVLEFTRVEVALDFTVAAPKKQQRQDGVDVRFTRELQYNNP